MTRTVKNQRPVRLMGLQFVTSDKLKQYSFGTKTDKKSKPICRGQRACPIGCPPRREAASRFVWHTGQNRRTGIHRGQWTGDEKSVNCAKAANGVADGAFT